MCCESGQSYTEHADSGQVGQPTRLPPYMEDIMKTVNLDGITLGKCKNCDSGEVYTSEGLCSECFDKQEPKYSEDELMMFGVSLDPYSTRGRNEK